MKHLWMWYLPWSFYREADSGAGTGGAGIGGDDGGQGQWATAVSGATNTGGAGANKVAGEVRTLTDGTQHLYVDVTEGCTAALRPA